MKEYFTNWETHESITGYTVQISPINTTPLDYLLPENWAHSTQMGNVRAVRSIDRLTTGENPHLIVKSPEHVYTRDIEKIGRGQVWWGGKRTWEKPMNLLGDMSVEDQIEREALVLLALHENNIPAEHPQAILTSPEGRKSILIQEIPTSDVSISGIRFAESRLRASELGFILEDSSQYNSLRDQNGNDRIIDVSRWQFPPLTNEYQERLVRTVREAALAVNAQPEKIIYKRKT